MIGLQRALLATLVAAVANGRFLYLTRSGDENLTRLIVHTRDEHEQGACGMAEITPRPLFRIEWDDLILRSWCRMDSLPSEKIVEHIMILSFLR